MKTIDEMVRQLVLDQSSMHMHTSGSYASVMIERDKLKLSDSSYEKDVFELFRSVYAQYEKIVHAVPELGPQRLAPPERTEKEYTEYTEVLARKPLEDDLPF